MKTKAKKTEPKAPKEQRLNRISIRFSATEMQLIREKAKTDDARTLARFARNSVMDSHPVQIPEINQKCWASLSAVASNLNQLQRRINSNQEFGIDEIKKILADLRMELIGVKMNENKKNNSGDTKSEEVN